jgi:hypothetical protein
MNFHHISIISFYPSLPCMASAQVPKNTSAISHPPFLTLSNLVYYFCDIEINIEDLFVDGWNI